MKINNCIHEYLTATPNGKSCLQCDKDLTQLCDICLLRKSVVGIFGKRQIGYGEIYSLPQMEVLEICDMCHEKICKNPYNVMVPNITS